MLCDHLSDPTNCWVCKCMEARSEAATLRAENERLKSKARRFRGWRVKSSTGKCRALLSLDRARKEIESLRALGWRDLRLARVYRRAKEGGRG